MIDRNGKRGMVIVCIDLDHLLKAEPSRDFRAHRRADQPFGMGRHKVNVLRGRKFRRADQVALVLAVRIVDRHDQPAGAQLVKRLNPDIGSQRLVNLVTAWDHELKEMMGGMGINSIEALRGNRLMLRGIGLSDRELSILGIKHAGE